MGFWFFVATLVISLAISYFFRPKPKLPDAQRPNLKAFEFTTNSAGRLVSIPIGTVKVEGNYIWSGGVRARPIRQKVKVGKDDYDEITVGYAWFADFAIAYCEPVDEIIAFYMNDKKVWEGSITNSAQTVSVRTGENSDIQGSGYSNSPVRFYNGHTAADSFLASQTGYNIAYKKLVYLVFEDAFVGDNVRTTPKYSLLVRRTSLIPSGTGGYTDWNLYENVNTSGSFADANPAHAILFILKELLRVPDYLIDFDSFRSAGIQLYNEGMGVSLLLEQRAEAEKWIEEILRTIDGVLFFDYETGKIKLKLIRDDYDPNTIPVVTDNDVGSLEFERRGLEDLASEITVRYTDRDSYKPATLILINPAVENMLGYAKSENYDFMAVTYQGTAMDILKRLLLKEAYPYATVKFTTSLELFRFKPGDVIKLQSDNLGVDIVLRILNVSGDKQYEQTIEVEAVEDIFSIGNIKVSTLQPNQGTAYTWDVGAVTRAKSFDAFQEMLSTSGVFFLYDKPSGNAIGVKVYINGEYRATLTPDLCGYATLATTYQKGIYENNVREIDDTGEIVINPVSNIRPISATREKLQRLGFVAAIGSDTSGWEFIAFQNLVDNGDGTYSIKNIIRGLMDTKISTHNSGEEVWIFYLDGNEIPVFSTEPSSITIDLIPFNHREQASAYSFSHSYSWTVEKPYPPSNLKANRSGDTVTISWVPRKRLSGANYRNIDNLPAGDGEGTYEGEWWVSWDNWASYEVVKPSSLQNGRVVFTRTDPQTKTYRIKSVVNGFQSEERSVVI